MEFPPGRDEGVQYRTRKLPTNGSTTLHPARPVVAQTARRTLGWFMTVLGVALMAGGAAVIWGGF